jgi:hypothetical protein
MSFEYWLENQGKGYDIERRILELIDILDNAEICTHGIRKKCNCGEDFFKTARLQSELIQLSRKYYG